jgi:hypothetical protein
MSIQKIKIFLEWIFKERNKKYNVVYNIMSLSVCAEGTCYPANKNNVFPLIGLCVSYNYFDTLKYMLPINYMHFEKLYILTHEDDTDTIEFCGNFDNVEVLLYNFVNNGKRFDKYGAINYAQHIIYKTFPYHWYLNIDSDIILPNNFIDILNKQNLNSDCIYGVIRNNLDKSSELLNKKQITNSNENLNWEFNNIIYFQNVPPSILGSFQLYKKHVYHRLNLYNAAEGDYYFGYDNFNLFCTIENILCFHLGKNGVNWSGKVVSFIHDINIFVKIN